MKKRFTQEQIAFALRQAESGTPVAEAEPRPQRHADGRTPPEAHSPSCCVAAPDCRTASTAQ